MRKNTSNIVNHGKRKETLKPGFQHIKYDETYIPEFLFLTLPELHNYQHDCFDDCVLMVFRNIRIPQPIFYTNDQRHNSGPSGKVPGLCDDLFYTVFIDSICIYILYFYFFPTTLSCGST